MTFEELSALKGQTIMIKYSDGSIWGTLESVDTEPPPYGIRLYLKNNIAIQYDPEIHEVFSIEKMCQQLSKRIGVNSSFSETMGGDNGVEKKA